MLMSRRLLLPAIVALAVIAAACTPAAKPAPQQGGASAGPAPLAAAPGGAAPGQVLSDTNPNPAIDSWQVADAPDPFVLRVDPSFCAPDGGIPTVCYYAYTTNVYFNPVPVWRSSDLVHWHLAGYDSGDADTFPDGTAVDLSKFATWSAEAFDKWAPAVFQVGSQYVMWYAARLGHGPHCLGVATASSPDGPFRDAKLPYCRDSQGGVIDPSPFVESNGTRYLTYKTEGTATQPPRIYAAELSGDGKSLLREGLLLERGAGWELPRIEGPTLWRTSSGLFLFYSAGDWQTASYVVGVARCNGPLGPCTRVYSTPVLTSRGSALGPGGETPFVDATGALRLAFHAWSSPRVGYSTTGATRSLRFLPVSFPGGNPKIG